MIFEDTVSIDAPAADVWDLLLDVNRFAACMPGVEEAVQVDASTFRGTISASVGPMSGKFSFDAHILESKPPTELLARVEGIDSVTKSRMDADMAMTLTAVEPNRTDLAYRATVAIHGRLAILGDMIMRATASLLLEEFTQRIRRQLASGKPA